MMNIIINIHINKEEIMKKIEKYRCEICKTEYSDKTKCLQCEKNHKTPVEITDTRYLPYSQIKMVILFQIQLNSMTVKH